MRDAYLNTLYKLAQKDKNVISLVADNGLIVYDKFRLDFPEQYFNFGISESNMLAAAAGMASCNKMPFVYTISSFLVYRGFEFIRNDICMQNLNVKIIGIGAGIAYSTLGPSHHTTEDIGLLRALPNLTLFSPATPNEVNAIMRAAYKIEGPVYIRLGTKHEIEIHDENYKSEFKVGIADEIKNGKDLTIISTGSIISEVLKASALLETESISVRVINMHTLKPIDTQVVIKAIEETQIIITVEEHNIIGGIASIVNEIITDNRLTTKLLHIGLQDKFANGYGTYSELRYLNKLDYYSIYSQIKTFINRI